MWHCINEVKSEHGIQEKEGLIKCEDLIKVNNFNYTHTHTNKQ